MEEKIHINYRFISCVCAFTLGIAMIGLSTAMYYVKDAYNDTRSEKLRIYSKVESMWNITYLNHFKNIDLEYIADYGIYNQVKNDTSLAKNVVFPIPTAPGKLGRVSESHLVNLFDEEGHIPEYEPMSYQIKYINPMVRNFTYSNKEKQIVKNEIAPPKVDLIY
jgi:hypothetical protein